MSETWMQVVGFEGIYEVSDLGNVRRIGPWSDGRKTKPVGILTHGLGKKYRRVVLYNGKLGKKVEVAVHRLVMAAFVGPIPFGYQVNHINGVKHDNRLWNLEYVTPSENGFHRYRVLKYPTRRGSKHHNAKLREDDVFAMRALRRRGWTVRDIAKEFWVSEPTTSEICNNKLWKHI